MTKEKPKIYLSCLPVWCKKCGVRAVRHLIQDGTPMDQVRGRIKDSLCGLCRGFNYTTEELKAQDEYEQTEEAKGMMPLGKWEGEEWQPES